MAPLPDVAVIRTYLDELYAGVEAGYLAIFHLPSQRATWVSATDLETATATIAGLDQAGNVYIGVGVQPAALGPSQRGTAASVSALPGLFMDIDLAGGEHASTTLPGDTRDVATLLREAVPVAPNFVVQSGGGLHVYWLFKEPWTLETVEERRSAARLNLALQRSVIAAARQRGWSLESTADLARVLRPAGTINRKRPDLPAAVRIIHQAGTRYSVDELEYYLPTDQDTYHPPRPPSAMSDRQPTALWSHIAGQCAFLKHCVRDAATLSEPQWHAMMTVVSRCRDGQAVAHRVSATYPRYDEAETTRKFTHSLAANAPLRCATIRHHRGGEPWCSQCAFWGGIASPIALGYPKGYRQQPASVAREGGTHA